MRSVFLSGLSNVPIFKLSASFRADRDAGGTNISVAVVSGRGAVAIQGDIPELCVPQFESGKHDFNRTYGLRLNIHLTSESAVSKMLSNFRPSNIFSSVRLSRIAGELLITGVASQFTVVAPCLSSHERLSVLHFSKNARFGFCWSLRPLFLGTARNVHARPAFLQCLHFPSFPRTHRVFRR